MIKYRPHRGGLDESMELSRNFEDIADMLNYIEKESDGAVKASDIVIKDSCGADDRIGWKSSRYVCTIQYGDEKYPIPQCIGTCDLGEKG